MNRKKEIAATLETLKNRAEAGMVSAIGAVVQYEDGDLSVICLVGDDDVGRLIVGLRRLDREFDDYLFGDVEEEDES